MAGGDVAPSTYYGTGETFALREMNSDFRHSLINLGKTRPPNNLAARSSPALSSRAAYCLRIYKRSVVTSGLSLSQIEDAELNRPSQAFYLSGNEIFRPIVAEEEKSRATLSLT